MKASLYNFSRFLALGVLTAGLSSCSLFRNGKYASQWEIESDVPASLNSGEATTPSASTAVASNVRSNLSGNPHLDPADTTSLDLPTSDDGGMVEVPKPEIALAHETREVGQSPVEMLSLPPASPETDLPVAPAGSYNNNSLLSAAPPVVTEEELAGVPAALAPEPTDDANVAAAAAADVSESPTPAAPSMGPLPGISSDAPGKEPAKAAAPTVIPLLYGKLDLTPYLNPASVSGSDTPGPVTSLAEQ